MSELHLLNINRQTNWTRLRKSEDELLFAAGWKHNQLWEIVSPRDGKPISTGRSTAVALTHSWLKDGSIK